MPEITILMPVRNGEKYKTIFQIIIIGIGRHDDDMIVELQPGLTVRNQRPPVAQDAGNQNAGLQRQILKRDVQMSAGFANREFQSLRFAGNQLI